MLFILMAALNMEKLLCFSVRKQYFVFSRVQQRFETKSIHEISQGHCGTILRAQRWRGRGPPRGKRDYDFYQGETPPQNTICMEREPSEHAVQGPRSRSGAPEISLFLLRMNIPFENAKLDLTYVTPVMCEVSVFRCTQ